MDEKKDSKISNVEWGLYIGANVVMDLIQAGLDLLVIGAFVNRFIDIFWGLCDGFYLQMRGQSLAKPKRLVGLLLTFVGEEVPGIDVLPLWTLDAIYNMMISKSDKILGQIPGGQMVSSAVEKAKQSS